MKTPSFDGSSVRTFLAKFENCALHNRWAESKQLHYLANCLEDPAAKYCEIFDLGVAALSTIHDEH